MEPHTFCGPEFILEVPPQSLSCVLEGVQETAAAVAASTPAEFSASPAPAESNQPGTTTTSSSSSTVGAASRGWTVQPSALLRIQNELYGVCTAEVRRHVHANRALIECMATDVRRGMEMVSRRMAHFGRIVLPASYGSTSGGGVPPPPPEVVFVQAKPTTALNPEEVASLQQSVRVAATSSSSTNLAASAAAGSSSPSASSTSSANTYLLLYITDSRVAAQLHMLCLRNAFIALPHACRLLNYFVSTGRAAAIVPSQVYQKRELLRSHLNFDAELWGVLESRLTDGLVERVRSSGVAPSGGRLFTAFEQHEQNVKAVLHYCETNVCYAGVFDDHEEASPFLVAMGLCWRLGLTMDDVCRHFARHPRRVIRALALYLARYTLAPEDYVYFFTPSLCDEVVIACTEDAQVTLSMRDLSRQLLTKNEVVDAWLPILSKHWQVNVVAPAMAFMETCWRLQSQGSRGGGEGDAAAASPGASTGASQLFTEADGSARGEPERVHGKGRGIAATFGFRSIAEIADHAAQHARVLVPQSIAAILKRRRGLEEEVFGGSGGRWGGDGDDAVDILGDDYDDDDFLIHVDVRGGDEDGDAEGSGVMGGQRYGGSSDLPFPSTKRVRTGAAKDGSGHGGVVLDPHRHIMREGLKLTLSLLGRRDLFRKDEEHYIEF
ncbi:putative PRP38 family [Leishmania utingensis]|uniref:PRP38 family n=1 Tax=Leishmania utingensis TaxID=653362 RepID=A0AAW3AFJ4_9TRYP